MTETEAKLRAAADAAPAAYLVKEPDAPPADGALWHTAPTAADLARMAVIGRLPVVVTPLKPAVDDEIKDALAQLATARAEAAEDEALRERMADLLTRTAAAIRGEPEPLARHTWHDLPERAGAAMAALAGALKAARDLAASEAALRDEVARLEVREKACATVGEAETRALLRALQECGDALGLPDPSPAQLVEAVKALVDTKTPTVEDINAQRWAGMDASTAFWLIQRHADDWAHAGRLMNAWRAANPATETAEAAGG